MQAKQFAAMKLNWLTENNSVLLVTSTVVALANIWKSSNYWRQKFLINQICQLYKQWSKLLSRRRELCNVKRPSNSATEKIKVIWRIMRTASTLQHSIAAVSSPSQVPRFAHCVLRSNQTGRGNTENNLTESTIQKKRLSRLQKISGRYNKNAPSRLLL